MAPKQEVILITGSSGYIGSALVRRFARDFQVVGFDKGGDPNPPIEAECVCVQIASDESVEAGLRRVQYAYGDRLASVIHLAAYYDFSGAPSPKYDEITVRGTERLLQGLQDFTVEQFIFSSSMFVHTPTQPGEPINEDSPLSARWPYPESKIKTEELIRAQRGSIPTVLLRIAGVYDDRCHSIPLSHQIQRIYERQFLGHFFPGDLSHGQAYMHLDDLVEVFVQLVQHREALPPELALLVGEPETLSYDELQRTIGRRIHGVEWKTYEIPKGLAKAGAWLQNQFPLKEEPFVKPPMIDFADEHYELDITQAKTLLDWEPEHTLRDILPVMIDALKADPAKWYQDNHLSPPPDPEAGVPPTTRKERHDERKDGEEMHPKQEAHHAMGDEEEPMAHMEMGDMHGEVTEDDPEKMLRQHHRQTLWVYLLIVLLGGWLISSPFSLGYTNLEALTGDIARVTTDRDLAAVGTRASLLVWNDVISGGLLILLGLLSLHPRRLWAPWAACFVGIWLLFAPLVFWSPSVAAFANDTLVGALVIALSVLIPGMPGMMLFMQPGPDRPPGWSYNPSAWLQRAPIITLGWISFFLARHLAAYQFGYISTAWDPFFGSSTMQILDSDISRAWPISDAGLGAVAYALEALMGYMGGKDRWRTMPWMVTFFGILVIPLGATSIILVILQPVAVGTWCTLCLITAIAMLIMIPLTLDEVIAMAQFLVQSVQNGKPFWRTFWLGGTIESGQDDERTPRFTAPLRETLPAMVWGMSIPWNLLLSALVGVWLMAAPDVLGSQGGAADSDHLAGALVVTVAVIAIAEVGRALRWINLPLGLWFVAAPWLLDGATTLSTWNNVIMGILLVFLSIPRGRVKETYGRWNRFMV